MRTLVVAEHDGSALAPATARTIRCATAIGAPIDVVMFASDADQIAAEAASLGGVERVLRVTHERHANPLAAMIAPQLAAIAQDYSHVLGPASTFGRDLMPAVAALLDTAQVSEVMAVDSPTRFRRPIYAGNAIETVEVPTPVVATVRLASFEPVDEKTDAAPVDAVEADAELPDHTRFVTRSAAVSDRPELQSARRVVAGGRAFGDSESFARLESLADLLGAAVGASRAAVDAGFAPNELQIGQTGKIIAPELYLAIGISGAIQHVTGIKDAGLIVAINRDAEAPIFEIADIGLVGDLFDVLPELETALKAL